MLNFDEIAGLGGATERQELARLEGLLQFDDPINIQITSGTTGHPKGATLTHHNILNTRYFIGEATRLAETDRPSIPVPLSHCFGMLLGNHPCRTHRCALAYPGEGLHPLADPEKT